MSTYVSSVFSLYHLPIKLAFVQGGGYTVSNMTFSMQNYEKMEKKKIFQVFQVFLREWNGVPNGDALL